MGKIIYVLEKERIGVDRGGRAQPGWPIAQSGHQRKTQKK